MRGQHCYVVSSDTVACHGDDGWTLPLDKVQTANFVQHRMGDQLMWRLDLGDGENLFRIATSSPHSTRAESEDCAAFVALCQQLSETLSEKDPDFRIGYGEYGKARVAMFAIGVVSTLAGIVIMIAALLSGVSGDRLIGGGIAMGVLVIFGLVLARGYSPWRNPIPIDVGRFPAVMAYLSGRKNDP